MVLRAVLEYLKILLGFGAALGTVPVVALAGAKGGTTDLAAVFGISIPAWLVWAAIAGAFIAALILGPEIVALIVELFSEGMTVNEILAY